MAKSQKNWETLAENSKRFQELINMLDRGKVLDPRIILESQRGI